MTDLRAEFTHLAVKATIQSVVEHRRVLRGDRADELFGHPADRDLAAPGDGGERVQEDSLQVGRQFDVLAVGGAQHEDGVRRDGVSRASSMMWSLMVIRSVARAVAGMIGPLGAPSLGAGSCLEPHTDRVALVSAKFFGGPPLGDVARHLRGGHPGRPLCAVRGVQHRDGSRGVRPHQELSSRRSTIPPARPTPWAALRSTFGGGTVGGVREGVCAMRLAVDRCDVPTDLTAPVAIAVAVRRGLGHGSATAHAEVSRRRPSSGRSSGWLPGSRQAVCTRMPGEVMP